MFGSLNKNNGNRDSGRGKICGSGTDNHVDTAGETGKNGCRGCLDDCTVWEIYLRDRNEEETAMR